MDPPSPQQQPDPTLIAQQQAAQREQMQALQVEAQMDTAALMARYGTAMAFSGGPGSPLLGPALGRKA